MVNHKKEIVHLPTANMNISLDKRTKIPILSIKNYNKLAQISQSISQQAKDLASKAKNNLTKAQIKKLRTRRRNINKLRKALRDLKKYYLQGFKTLNKQDLNLIKILGNGTSSISDVLKLVQVKNKKVLKEHLKPIMHQFCQNEIPPIPDQEIPDDCLKASMSKADREKLMRMVANQGKEDALHYLYWKRLHVAKIVNHKVIDPATKQPIAHTVAHQSQIIGHPEDIEKLENFARKLHVYLHIK